MLMIGRFGIWLPCQPFWKSGAPLKNRITLYWSNMRNNQFQNFQERELYYWISGVNNMELIKNLHRGISTCMLCIKPKIHIPRSVDTQHSHHNRHNGALVLLRVWKIFHSQNKKTRQAQSFRFYSLIVRQVAYKIDLSRLAFYLSKPPHIHRKMLSVAV